MSVTVEPEEARTESGIFLPAPDDGIPYVHLRTLFPGADLAVWEPFGDGQEGGHNVSGFAGRWEAFIESGEPFLTTREPRYGFPHFLPRNLIGHLLSITIGYMPRKDVRAQHRTVALPAMMPVEVVRGRRR